MRGPWLHRHLPVVLLVVGLLLSAAGAAAGQSGQPVPRGATLGPNFRISTSRANEQTPAVAYNSVSHEYLVVWQDDRTQATRGTDIYGRRVAADGSRIGGDVRISRSSANADEVAPAVAYNPADDQYLVVWEDERPDAIPGSDIYGQRLAAEGTLVGRNFRVDAPSNPDGASAGSPALAYNSAAGEYLVIWEDWRDAEFPLWGGSIYGARLAADGTHMGPDFEVGFGSSENVTPQVAYNPVVGQYLAVWTGIHWADEEVDEDVDCSEIFGRRLSATGAPIGGVFLVSAAGCNSWPGMPGVTYLPAANYHYLVVWEEEGGSGRGRDIFGRRAVAGSALAGGAVVGNPFRISGRGAVGDETHPRPALNSAAGGLVVVWKDTRNQLTRGADIYGRRLTNTVLPSGADFRISGKAATTNEGWPEVAYNAAADQYLVVFHTDRFLLTRGWEIHGQRVAG